MSAVGPAPADDDEALFQALRRGIRRRQIRLRFTDHPVAPFFEGFYRRRMGMAGLLAASVPLLYIAIVVGVVTALWTVARHVPSLAPAAKFIAEDRLVGIPVLGACLLIYFVWRRYAVLHDLDVWDSVWRSGALKLVMRDGSISCKAPQDDWRVFARNLGGRS